MNSIKWFYLKDALRRYQTKIEALNAMQMTLASHGTKDVSLLINIQIVILNKNIKK